MTAFYTQSSISPGNVVSSTANLAAVNTTNFMDGTRYQVTGTGIYQFSLQSTSGTVLPTTGPGSWSLVTAPYILMNANNQIDGSQVSVSDVLSLNDGSAAAPSFNYAADLTTGFYRIGTGHMGWTTSGVLRLDLSTTAFTSTVPHLLPAGTAGAPALAFSAEATSGLYRISSNNLGISIAGTLTATINASSLTLASGIALVAPAGTVAAPAVAVGEVGTGLYQTATHQIGVSINGGLVATIAATTITIPSTVSLIMSNPGANGTPTVAIGEAVSGFYASASHQVALAINSATMWIQTATQLQMQSGIAILSGAGLVATPAVAIGETATGFYQTAAHQVGITCNGALSVTVTGTAINMATGTALQVNATQVVTSRKTGWTIMTGTPSRSTFATSSVTTAQLAGVVMALQQDLGITAGGHGLIDA